MGKDTIVWITARDGSLHATQPPIIADRQQMLCGQFYGRLDLRIRLQGSPGQGPAGACQLCRDTIASSARHDLEPVGPALKPEPDPPG